MSEERSLLFNLDGDDLLGIVHLPSAPAETGVLVVVGGPQYRIGAHRQFVHLARYLARQGIAVMRFDYRGIGDSEGPFRGFEGISEDIDAALAAFKREVPTLRSVVLWGLCDAASAIVMRDYRDPLVAGAVVLNPWVRTEAGEAKAYLKHYYLKRLCSLRFWKKILGGAWRPGQSLRDFGRAMKDARGDGDSPLPQRVLSGMAKTPFPLLVILSGQDLVAREFEDVGGRDLLADAGRSGITLKRLPPADHTFSKAAWKEAVAKLTLDWIRSVSARQSSVRPE